MSGPVGPDLSFLRQPRRLAAIAILALTGAVIAMWLIVRGELVGADARAYWGAVRLWLDGGDILSPPPPYMPYVYVPWSVPLFLPWAALPWDTAWFAWRSLNLLLLLWSAAWAYARRPLATALLVAFLAAPLTATLDTGNITLLCALSVWAARFIGPRVGGFLWALSTALKWFPLLLFVVLPARARRWGILWLAIAGLLSLAVWPATLEQLRIAVGYPRPLRIDYLLLLWAAVPWMWSDARFFEPRAWPGHLAEARERAVSGLRAWWATPARIAVARSAASRAVRGLLGIEPVSR